MECPNNAKHLTFRRPVIGLVLIQEPRASQCDPPPGRAARRHVRLARAPFLVEEITHAGLGVVGAERRLPLGVEYLHALLDGLDNRRLRLLECLL